jgi:hypothetical protein
LEETKVQPYKEAVCVSEEVWPDGAIGLVENTKLEITPNGLV